MTRAHARHASLDVEAEQLRDHIADLTRTRSHREVLNRPAAAGGRRDHFTRVPPLLDQLRYGDWTTSQQRGGSAFESRPAASVESLDTLIRIDLEAARWVRDLGEDDPGDTIECVRFLGGLVASARRCRVHPRGHQHDGQGCHLDSAGRRLTGWCCTWHNVAADVARWWTQARIITGWDQQAWSPDNTCPACGERRTLRIRLEERLGFCTSCRETWGPESYQELAAHVRAESEARRTPVAGPCWCPWPLSTRQADWVGVMFGLCPRCGSASCRHAVRSTGTKAV